MLLTNKYTNIINVHVTPKSGRDCLCGLEPDQKGMPLLKIKVTAPPDKGKANMAVCNLLSKSIKVPKSKINVIRGHKSRYKQVGIDCEQEKFNSWLNTCL